MSDRLDKIEDLITSMAAEISFAYGGSGYGEVGDIVDKYIKNARAEVDKARRELSSIDEAWCHKHGEKTPVKMSKVYMGIPDGKKQHIGFSCRKCEVCEQ